MASFGQHGYDDRSVIQYLLGATSGEETDRLDELSITDDEFASRLRSAENDLVDAYAKGELEGETLERFKSFYLASASRLEKVRFAEAMETMTNRSVAVPQMHRTARPTWERVLFWSVAAAAAALLLVTGYLVQENRRLQREFAQQRERPSAPEQRPQVLPKRLDDSVSATRPAKPPPAPKILAFALLPQTRGAGSLATIMLPPGAGRVVFNLTLESDDFPEYRAALRDPASNQIIWRSARLKARPNGTSRGASVSLPGNLLRQQNYALELTGIPPGGEPEFVSTYAFRVGNK
jgi:hypothetical protein